MSTEPDLKCFCPTNTTCLKKGAFDLTKCIGKYQPGDKGALYNSQLCRSQVHHLDPTFSTRFWLHYAGLTVPYTRTIPKLHL